MLNGFLNLAKNDQPKSITNITKHNKESEEQMLKSTSYKDLSSAFSKTLESNKIVEQKAPTITISGTNPDKDKLLATAATILSGVVVRTTIPNSASDRLRMVEDAIQLSETLINLVDKK